MTKTRILLVAILAMPAAACTAVLGLDDLGDRPATVDTPSNGTPSSCVFDESKFDDGCILSE